MATKQHEQETTTAPVTVYGAADIADALGVSRPTFSNYLVRYDETPAPSYVTPSGRQFWSLDALDAWRSWAGVDA